MYGIGQLAQNVTPVLLTFFQKSDIVILEQKLRVFLLEKSNVNVKSGQIIYKIFLAVFTAL